MIPKKEGLKWRWILLTAVFILVTLPTPKTYSASAVIYQTDFETDPGWTVNPSGTDTAGAGFWEVGNPQETTNAGVSLQLGTTTSGSQALVTGASAGSSVGAFDVDGGVTSVQSPAIWIPADKTAVLSFKYYFGHNSSATANDFFKVSVIGDSTQTVVEVLGAGFHNGAEWTAVSYLLTDFAGQNIQILVEAADDNAAGALIEAGVDDVAITEYDIELQTGFNNGASGFTYQDDSFRNTTQPTYADGAYSATAGRNGGGLWVEVGGVNGDDINNMSGGWTYTFSLDKTSDVLITFYYNLNLDVEYEDNEYGEALVSVDGQLYGQNGNDYLARFYGTDSDQTTGWQLVVLPLETLSAGNHTLAIGAFNNTKTTATEITTLYIDDVDIYVEAAGTKPQLTPPSDQTSTEGDTVNLSLTASDPLGGSLNFSADGLPSGLSINDSGVISGLLDNSAEGSYTVTITASNAVDSRDVVFNWLVLPQSAGQIIRQWWTGIGGTAVSNLTNNSNYPNNPTGEDFLTLFEAPEDWADDYGTRIYGYIVPPETGDYTFWIASDDNGQLWLSTDHDPANVQQISNVPDWTASRDWHKHSSQQSAPISLQAGQRYYIEALQKEGGGLDNLAVAWQIPSQDSLEVIPGDYLLPPNSEPTLTSPGNQTNIIGDTINLQLSASDPDNDGLTFQAINLPNGLNLNSNTGQISGTPTVANTFAVSISIDDGFGGTDNRSFTWTINEPPNSPPTITNPGDQTNTVNDAVNLTIVASDANGDSLTFSANNLPNGLSINANSGLISGTVTTVDSFAVVVTVSDGVDSANAVFVWTVSAPPNTAPTITNPGDQENILNDSINLQISASDADGDSLTFSASNLPTGLSINANSGLISGTVTAVDSFAVVVTVSDGEDSRDAVFAWIVNEPPNTPPVLVDPDDQVNIIGDSANLIVSASDDDGDSLTFSAQNLPTGLSINANNGSISGTVTEVDAYAVILTVSDGEASDSTVFAWTVNDLPNNKPTITDPGDQDNILGDSVSVTISATDADDDPLTFSADGLPDGLSINANSGLISGTPTAAGSFAVIVTVDDGRGGTATAVFAWSISEIPNSPPVVTDPPDQTNVLNDTVSLQVVAVDANVEDVLVYTAVNLPPGVDINSETGLISGTLTQSGRYAILIIVEDNHGDSDNAIFKWVINDASSSNTNPEIVNPTTQASTLNETVSLELDASDADNDPLTYSAMNLPTGLAINPNTGQISGTVTEADSYPVVITVTDGNGGTASAVFIWIVNVVPNTLPEIAEPDDQANIVGDTVNLDIDATDADGDSLVFSAFNLPAGLSIHPTSGVISGELSVFGQYAVIVTVDDGKGGEVNATFLWLVNATINNGPSVIDPGNQTHIIGESINLSISAADVDEDALTFSVTNLPPGTSLNPNTGLISGIVNQIGLYPVTVSVNDGRGGIASTSFVWSVIDVPNNLPIITNPGPQSHLVNEIVSLQIIATDSDSDSLIYIATDLPNGLQINANTGLISGKVKKKGAHLVVVAVYDGLDTAETSFIWQVDEVVVPNEIFTAQLPLVTSQHRRDEPNDICAEAHWLNLNSSSSFAHEDLEDWYKFTTTKNEALTIELSNFTASGQIIVYRGGCGNLTFLQNNGNYAAQKVINLGLSPAGTYFVRIITDDNYNDPTPYTLTVVAP